MTTLPPQLPLTNDCKLGPTFLKRFETLSALCLMPGLNYIAVFNNFKSDNVCIMTSSRDQGLRQGSLHTQPQRMLFSEPSTSSPGLGRRAWYSADVSVALVGGEHSDHSNPSPDDAWIIFNPTFGPWNMTQGTTSWSDIPTFGKHPHPQRCTLSATPASCFGNGAESVCVIRWSGAVCFEEGSASSGKRMSGRSDGRADETRYTLYPVSRRQRTVLSTRK